MSSNIDETIPADNVKADKSQFRDNFRAAKDEIESLQRAVSLPWRIALGLLTL